jgi:hypothetical protein
MFHLSSIFAASLLIHIKGPVIPNSAQELLSTSPQTDVFPGETISNPSWPKNPAQSSTAHSCSQRRATSSAVVFDLSHTFLGIPYTPTVRTVFHHHPPYHKGSGLSGSCERLGIIRVPWEQSRHVVVRRSDILPLEHAIRK